MENSIAVDEHPTSNSAPGARRTGAAKIVVAAAILVFLFVMGDDLARLLPAFATWVESLGIWGPFVFATGYAAILAGDLETAARAVERMNEQNDVAAAGPLCGRSGGFGDTTKRDLIVAGVMQESLRGLVHMARGDQGARRELGLQRPYRRVRRYD